MDIKIAAYPKQMEFIRCQDLEVGFIAGIGCVAAETEIEGIPIAERTQPAPVSTLLGESMATPSYLKGKADLYRVQTESGVEVVVTETHRFLTPLGWRPLSALTSGDVIGADGTYNDYFERKRLQGWKGHYSPNSCRGGGLSSFWELVVQNKLQLPHMISYVDNTWVPFYFDLLSTDYFFPHGPCHLCDEQYEISSDAYGLPHHLHDNPPQSERMIRRKDIGMKFPQSEVDRLVLCNPSLDEYPCSEVSGLHPIDTNAIFEQPYVGCQVQEKSEQLSRNQSYDSYAHHYYNIFWDEVTSIQFVKYGDYYDLQVPSVGHYSAHGLWHHNSGKTHAGAQKSLVYCLANPGAKGIITAPTNRILDQATIPTYDKVFPVELLIRQIKRPYPMRVLANGSELHFWSTDNAETIVGAEYAFAHMDEGSLSSYMAIVNIRKRLRQKDKGGEAYPYQLWITTTPRQLNWLYREITKPDNPIVMFNASTGDNTFIDEEQRKAYIARQNLTGKDYEQEIEGKFVLLTGDCLVAPDILEQRLNDCLEPVEVRDGGYSIIWKQPVVGVRYIAGADCADEGGGGVNDLIIMDVQSGEEVAEINADIPADKFAQLCFTLCRDYHWPLLAPERNGTVGGIVIQKLRDMAYDNLFVDEHGKEGWYTIPGNAIPPKVSRLQMLKEYEEAVRLRQTIIHSSDAIGELSTFVREEGGKYIPREGCRSDRIMARAICWQLRKSRQGHPRKIICVKRLVSSYA